MAHNAQNKRNKVQKFTFPLKGPFTKLSFVFWAIIGIFGLRFFSEHIWEIYLSLKRFWPINGANFYIQVLAHCVKSGQWTCSRWVKNTENTHIYKHTHTHGYTYYDHLEPLLFLPCDLGVIWSIPPPFCQLTFRTSALSDQ